MSLKLYALRVFRNLFLKVFLNPLFRIFLLKLANLNNLFSLIFLERNFYFEIRNLGLEFFAYFFTLDKLKL